MEGRRRGRPGSNGVSKPQAASIAKNISVNFNRKGQSGQQAGALYAFFNAAMQGTARIGETMTTMEKGDIKTFRFKSAYEKYLYVEISAITYFNHLDAPLRRMLERPDLHHRLINGSDYPLGGINVVIQTGALQRDGFITADERQWLNEIYRKNPLLFDFVVKRTVRHPETGKPFRPEAFLLPEHWPRAPTPAP